MISYVNSNGCVVRYSTIYLALLNWFIDNEEDDKHPIIKVASGADFIPQMLAAVERRIGKQPRIDFTKTEEEQYADILRYVCAAGDIKKLKITRK